MEVIKREFLGILQDYVEFPVEEIVNNLEEHFGITVPNNDLIHFKSIDDIVTYISRRKAA